MKVSFYLIVSANGKVRTTKTKPGLDWDEIAILQSVDLPNSLFQKPQLHASIVVDEASISPKVITPEMQDNIAAAIHEASGMEVKITFPEAENV